MDDPRVAAIRRHRGPAVLAAELRQLAQAAYPLDDADYGSNRQVDAENLFFETLRAWCPGVLDADFDGWCLKATTEEMLDAALERLDAWRNR